MINKNLLLGLLVLAALSIIASSAVKSMKTDDAMAVTKTNEEIAGNDALPADEEKILENEPQMETEQNTAEPNEQDTASDAAFSLDRIDLDDNLDDLEGISKETADWGLTFDEEGGFPVGNATAEELKKYDAYYLGDTSKKVIYITFDGGYENGYTEKLLDALKKHNAPAAFFLVGNYLETSPDIVRRMQKEGHIVANHMYHHPDMEEISEIPAFQKEVDDLANLYKEITGEEMIKYFRPPQGKYNAWNLALAKKLGYRTFFWSLAYVDWLDDSQPTHDEAYGKLLSRIHPGAIVLLHSTSKTNGEILDGLLTKWEEMGYTFGSLTDIQ